MYILLTTICLGLIFILYKTKCPFVENGWSKYVRVPAKRYNPKTRIGKQMMIPKIIMQTNEKDYIPIGMSRATDTLIQTNPEYNYIYFSDDQARKYIDTHYSKDVLEAYDTLIPGAYKADLFRYCFLNANGGVYIDMGMVATSTGARLDDIIESNDIFVAPEDNGTGRIYNAFMASTPKNPILLKAIQLIVDNVKYRKYSRDSLGITGPGLLATAFEQVTGKAPIVGLSVRDDNGVMRIIEFNKYLPCESGTIKDNKRIFLFTKYPGYRKDQQWYNTNPHYSTLWRMGRVYNSFI